MLNETLLLQGCTTGPHSNEKPKEPEKPEKIENEELVSFYLDICIQMYEWLNK